MSITLITLLIIRETSGQQPHISDLQVTLMALEIKETRLQEGPCPFLTNMIKKTMNNS